MIVRAASSGIRTLNRPRLRRRHGSLARIAGCFFASLAATYFVGLETQINVIWVANGLLLSYLLLERLLAKPRAWHKRVGAGRLTW